MYFLESFMLNTRLINRDQLQELIHKQEALNIKYGGVNWRDGFSFGQAKLAMLAEVGEFLDEVEQNWHWYKSKPNYHKQKALFELIDVVHFALMIALYHDSVDDLIKWSTKEYLDDRSFTHVSSSDKSDDFATAIGYLLASEDDAVFLESILNIINSGAALIGGDFDENAIYHSYIMKNQRNEERVSKGVLVGAYDKSKETDLVYDPKVR